MNEITFKNFLRTTSLPFTIKEYLLDALNNRTQAKLLKCVNAEKIIALAIEDVDLGSVETLKALIRDKLKELRG